MQGREEPTPLCKPSPEEIAANFAKLPEFCWGLDLRAGDKPSIFRALRWGTAAWARTGARTQAMPNETESSARIHSDTQVELKYISLGTPCFRLCLRFPLEVGSLGSKSRAAPAH
jgi:hypothetical protein